MGDVLLLLGWPLAFVLGCLLLMVRVSLASERDTLAYWRTRHEAAKAEVRRLRVIVSEVR